jgi:hypothetical protein
VAAGFSEMSKHGKDLNEQEELPLSRAAQYLLEECRMVLPGMQALFGFQLIVVFSPTFSEKLNQAEHLIHFFAMTLTAIAVALIMTPAALHRAIGSRLVTSRLVQTSASLLYWSMPCLALSICLEFYLIGRVVIGAWWVVFIAAALLCVFITCWFIVPRYHRVVSEVSTRKVQNANLRSDPD